MKDKRTIVYPGTFDPITLGHLSIIKRSVSLFNKLVIAVATDTTKKSLFSIEERVSMIQHEINIHKIQNTIIKPFQGLLVTFIKKENASTIIRGLRAVTDFEYELQMSFINKTLDTDIETVFLPAIENLHFISSTFVKEIARLNGDTKNFVTINVQNLLTKKFQNA